MKGVVLLLLISSCGFAAEVTPEVRALLDKMVLAQGGRSNLEQVKGLRMVVEAATASGDVRLQIATSSTWETAHVRTKLPNGFQSSQVYDGKTAWAQHPTSGVRQLDGPAKSGLIRNTLRAARHRESTYDLFRMGPVVTFDGRVCVTLVASNKGEKDVIFYVDQKSYRVVGTKVSQGGVTGTTTFRQFVRSEKGIFYPSELTIEANGTRLMGKVVKYAENPTFAKGLFDKPTAADSKPAPEPKKE